VSPDFELIHATRRVLRRVAHTHRNPTVRELAERVYAQWAPYEEWLDTMEWNEAEPERRAELRRQLDHLRRLSEEDTARLAPYVSRLKQQERDATIALVCWAGCLALLIAWAAILWWGS
jgi:hypothetical protein